MKNREMEQKIKMTIQHSFSNDSDRLQKILSECDLSKGEEYMQQNIAKKKTPKWVRWVSVAAAVVCVGIISTFGAVYYTQNISVDSEIILDVNPSIEMSINAKEKVVDVTAQNEDAVAILDGMDLKGTDLNVAVNALLGSLVKHGYIDELANSILVTVENDNANKGAQLQQDLVAEINRILSGQSIQGAVLGQNISKNTQLQELANQYQISLGKAALVQTLTQINPLYSIEEMSKLSIHELNLLLESQGNSQQNNKIQSTGSASDKAYIGEEKAKEIALSHAGLSENDVTIQKIKLDYDDGMVEYDVEFFTATQEYDYNINAQTGDVVSNEIEPFHANNTSPQGQGATITLEQAKQAALSHAGVSANAASFKKVELENDDNKLVYELEFYTSDAEYDYKIDASSGAVLSYDQEQFNQGGSSNHGSSISEEEARRIAQNKAPNAQIVSFQPDRDDGQEIYEIELREGNIEYDCEIRKSDGAIIKWEQDIDD
ncbi:MAG: cell wall protein [Massilioclostridium sp.]|nr:MAG: cell wall protein [Massilioclostridium sp.]PWN00784.1 MAG: cell wall protein [Massilioclostridium sp.]